MQTLTDSSLETTRYSNLVGLLNLYSYFYQQSFLTLSSTADTRLNIDRLCHIMRFKVELKEMLQDLGISYKQYKSLENLSDLFAKFYEVCGVSPISCVQLKFNDFVDYGKSTQHCVSVQNFEYFINATFIPELEKEEMPDVRLSYENFIV
ncbi:hypothetical protein Cantr_02695 [Candida viswanathii]|uniref:Uncharacterized protein n=1 Tax=Candida viswanathii TaxID=5486 RepID=A0A367YNV2_9ASCO|nr:hypothetical protein Cantr_02695 [Candida viswanathii]